MNKAQLEKELKKYMKRYNDEKENNNFLIRQQKELKKLAEKAGTELAPYKAMVEKMKDKIESLESTIKILGDRK